MFVVFMHGLFRPFLKIS